MQPRSSGLKIHGGTAAFPQGPPPWPRPDEAVREALLTAYEGGGWGKYHGPHVPALTSALAKMHQVPHAHLCASGTLAVELALRGLQVGPGDEVVLAGYDFEGNFRAIELVGALPVLVDIDPENWCLDPGTLEAACGAKTKAIIVSHLHGGLAPMQAIMEFATARGIAVVEDACQAPGAMVEGRMAGSWGDCGILSFGGSKLLTAGRGGAVLTQNSAVHQRIGIFVERGNDAFALSELQAAVLLPQLATLQQHHTHRAEQRTRLLAATEPLSQLRPVVNRIAGTPVYYKVAWSYEPEQPTTTRQMFTTALQHEGVAIDSGFHGFSRRSDRRCRKATPLPHALRAAESTVLLHHPILLADSPTIDRVAAAIHKVAAGLAAIKNNAI